MSVACGTTLKGLLTNCGGRTTIHVRRCCGEHRRFNIKVDLGVSIVVGVHSNVIHALCIQTPRLEEINGLNHGVIEIERRDIRNDIVVDGLFIPTVACQFRRNTVRGVVQQIRLYGCCEVLSGFKVVKRTDGRRLRLWIGQEGRVLLPNGEVVNSKPVKPGPAALVIIGS